VIDEESEFQIEVTLDDCNQFAQLSGDWNPLHTNAEYAKTSVYKGQVLHGAYSAGLISRLAGMYLPGNDCLLYSMRLRFVVPIQPPVNLEVKGRVVAYSNEVARVEATITNVESGTLYVDASYEFSSHRMSKVSSIEDIGSTETIDEDIVLITGSTGGLGEALLRRLGGRGKAAVRSKITNRLESDMLIESLAGRKISAIVHCGWPIPDNRRFIELDRAERAIDQHIASPIRDIQLLSALLAEHGNKNAPLIVIGSTAVKPGRHYYRMPLYSIAKSTIPTIVNILALELAPKAKRCIGVVFDMIDGGMSKGISESMRLASADRSPWGELATPDEAAEQITWLLENQSRLISGAILTLSSGSIP